MATPRNKNAQYYIAKRYDGMMGRCYRKTDKSFRRYGARGIRVARDWILDKTNFENWFFNELSKMGVSDQEFVERTRELQLDRTDTDGHYSPENCRIVSRQMNTRNRKAFTLNKIISAEGDEIEL